MQMASSPKFVCLFFLLTTLVFSLQSYARDSHFFSKVTRNRDEDASAATTTTTPNTNKFFINNKESDEFVPLNKQEDEPEPIFLPQTTESGYGLYGHETGLNPPSTTTTTLYNMDDNTKTNTNNNGFDNFNNYYKNTNENNHHEKNYAHELKGLSTTNTYRPVAAPTKFINNNYNNNNNNNYNNNDEGVSYGVRRDNGMQERQGMSDTRFLENGKYYYDVNNEEKNYYPNSNSNYVSYPKKHHNNNYETNGYYVNNDEVYYGNHNNNNVNNNFHGNGMKGYHNNQIPQDERFDFDDQP